MNFNFIQMNHEYANEIAYKWKYKDQYSFYDMTADEEDLKDLLDEKNWTNKYFACVHEDSLVGFYSIKFEEGIMWIGLALKPELTGQGLGQGFVQSGIDFAIQKFNYRNEYVMLTVWAENERAIKSYEKIGFRQVSKHTQKTNGGEYNFIKMKKMV